MEIMAQLTETAKIIKCSKFHSHFEDIPCALAGWLSWLECHLIHQRLQVRSPVRAYTQIEGLIPGQGVYSRQLIGVFLSHQCFFFFKDFIYLFLQGKGGRRKGRETSLCGCLQQATQTCPTTQACALTGNQTSDSLLHRPALNSLSHTSRGSN